MLSNESPSIDSVSDAPDPIKANADLTFAVNWNDPDAGEQVKIHICKTNSLSGQTCSGGSWCNSDSFTINDPATCIYTTSVSDEGNNTYNAFVCDDENACSSSNSETFFVDSKPPIVSSWSIDPENTWTNGAITISWSVLDLASSSKLDRVEVFRAVFGTDDWQPVGTPVSAPPNTSTWTCNNCVTDSPSSNTYWYGINVYDKAQNKIIEPTPPGPKKALVDKKRPTSVIQLPLASSSHGTDFPVTVADVDTGGSELDINECTYSILFDDGTCGAGPCRPALSNASRACNADTLNISLADHCSVEGVDACRVFVKSKDITGNSNVLSAAQGSIRDFSIDLTWPVVDRVSCSANLSIPCSAVQQGAETTFRAAVSDNIQLSNCQFLWRISPSGSWQEMQAPDFTSINCQGDHSGNCLETFTVHSFDSGGSFDVRAQCWDGAFHTMPGDFVTITTEILSASLVADPAFGTITTQFDLSSTVSNTATGNANFRFDCDTDQAPTWDFEIDNIDLLSSDPGWVTKQGKQTKVIAEDTFAVKDLCQYTAPNTYTASTQVERGVSTATDTVSIDIVANTSPKAINLAHNNATANYCFVQDPPIILSWEFFDPVDSQSAYQVKIGNIDTGKVVSANTEYSPPNLSYNTTYQWQVKVWDSLDSQSVPEWATGPSFTTLGHAFPSPDFSFSPAFPSAEEDVTFTDTTTFAVGSTNQSWAWDFGDTASSSQQNPVHTYQENGAFLVTLSTQDDAGSCQVQKTINITLPFPDWQEISPF